MVDPEFITSLVVYAIAISAVAVYFPCTWYMIVYVCAIGADQVTLCAIIMLEG